ncbi:CAD protein [Aphelenchoides besseyi]|nr:CAD protein [Aphelenchoides besseyi]
MVYTGFVTMSAKLILDDGSVYHGQSFGAPRSAVGEIVFQTGMVGYVESLSDPSYARQLLTLTYPLIGNYGVADQTAIDDLGLPRGFESDRVWPAALIVERICPEGEHSHWQATQSLSHWLKKHNVPGLCGIDVRELTMKIRERGTMKAKLVWEGDDEKSIDFVDINADNLVAAVSRKESKTYGNGPHKVLAVDCGLKYNQIRCLVRRGCSVNVVPHNFSIDEVIDEYDGLFLSNGPGDPSMCSELIERIQRIIERQKEVPVFGICLGNQLLAKAAGADTFKLLYGNRGHNQPCIHLETNRCFITSQNHGYAVNEKTLADGWQPLFRNANDNTNEGIIHKNKPFFSVQFHPEHAAGPTDMECLFDVFVETMKEWKSGNKINVNDVIKKKLHYESKYNPGKQQKVLVIGSGGLSIGQAGEFDYSGAQAIKALMEEGVRTVLVNPNVATVQTSKGFADRTYFVPITKEYVTDVIKKERPTGILCTFGGQTALNCAVDLYRDGILEQYNVQVLGTPIPTIIDTEDREKFNFEINRIGEKVATSEAARTVDEACRAAKRIGYPVLVRAAFALGGLGSGFADNEEQLTTIARQAFAHSDQVLIDKSLRGWKEVEYEVVRDAYDNCITVCNMENIDPLGIHTGESVVVAPSQTLTNDEYNSLRRTAIKVIRHFGIIGECNIQYALNPNTLQYFIIEVNARLSRSSALASKATGYPLAYIAAKLALGKSLPELRNTVTGKTTACFEPSLDYCVVKIPRWDLGKFVHVNTTLGSSMKSVGEVMGIGRSFEEAFQKALRMVNDNYTGFSPKIFRRKPTDDDFINPTDKRMLAIARSMHAGDRTVEEIHRLTHIDRWFLHRMQNIADIYSRLTAHKFNDESLILEAKRAGFSDQALEEAAEVAKGFSRKYRQEHNLSPCVKQIDTVAGEWPASTNYLYLTYNGQSHDVEFKESSTTSDVRNMLVLGSGVYRIGSSVEFDACCVGCVKELKRLGHKAIMVNCNPETVSTDYDICDRLYFEEISIETVSDINALEHSSGIILSFGGQAGNNIAKGLPSRLVFGTSPSHIDEAEDRYKFSRALDKLGIKQPAWVNATSLDDAVDFCNTHGYPCLIRPSYVLSGAAMNVAHNEEELRSFIEHATYVARDKPVVVSKFIQDAKEIDVDAVASDGFVLAMAISEHIENAGIHSGDATLVTPPQDLNSETQKRIQEIVYRIARQFRVTGPFNMQLIAKNNELFVIECNLRVSRSFPFVSKTLDFDFIALATRAIMGKADELKSEYKSKSALVGVKGGKVGVKVPQFSFSRLAGADVVMGVEMVSTGEVACFGRDRYEAYLKGLLSTGFVVPRKSIFLSIGGVYYKEEFLNSVRDLHAMGYELYASKGTADCYQRHGIKIHPIEWPFEEGNAATDSEGRPNAYNKTISDFVSSKGFDLMIILPIRGSGSYRISAYRTHGYKTRRMAIDNGIPLVSDIKCAKFYVAALKTQNCQRPPTNSQFDCLSNTNLQRLPGLIDVHVHVREPGQEHKETWETASRAAIAGGITMILAMPNTQPPLTDPEVYNRVDEIANSSSFTDYGLYVGATAGNTQWNEEFSTKAAALKMYLNQTFGTLQLPSITDWIAHFKNFPKDRPIVCHAEGQTLLAVLGAAQIVGRHVHIAHVSNKEEIEIIREAKRSGWDVTCEVCPHHLLLTQSDLEDGWREVRPRLSKTTEDIEALWKNLEYIDCFATDHAPHTRDEKSSGDSAPPGFPSIEYMLPLLLTAFRDRHIDQKELIARLYDNPRRIFNLPVQPNTYIEVDMEEEWTIPKDGGQSKAQWTPFANRQVCGRVRSVVIRGEEVFVDGNYVARPGIGCNIRALSSSVALESSTQPQRHPSSHDGDSPARSVSPFRPIADRNHLYGQDLLSITDLSKPAITQVLDLASRFRDMIREKRPVPKLLSENAMALMFYEVSTRTRCSFEIAMKRLGGKVTTMDESTSSVQKGEPLDHSVRMMSLYASASGVVVIRHPDCGAAKKAANVADCPVINAGDGVGEHPTQALLDLYTIREELSTVNRLTIALVGDLKHGRTVHSLAKLLCHYRDITLHYVSPNTKLGMPQEVRDYVSKHSNFKQVEFNSLEDGIKGVDLIYMTRIQKERFANTEDFERVKGQFVLTAKLLNAAGTGSVPDDELDVSNAQTIRPIVMHPLPCVGEISSELDTDDRSAYFRQAENGVYIRMALLTLILREDFEF